MLVLNNITFEFGDRALYSDASLHIRAADKIGLIGANGTGKSTLLRVITGEYSVSSGEVTRRNGLSISFLNQDLLSYETDDMIVDVALEAFPEQIALEKEIERLLILLETDHSEEVIHALSDAQHRFEILDGYTIRAKTEKILEGLGFTTESLSRPLKTFSGGWRMRVMLAQMLLRQPDILLLDEPTNHLDLPSILWLENYLIEYPGAIVVVSHDRYFLDKVVNKIVEVAQEDLIHYPGNFTNYMEEKAQRQEIQKSQFKNQQQHIKEQERLIDRFKAKASKASMAQSRMKALDRMEKIEDVDDDTAVIKIRFDVGVQPGRVLAELDIKEKSYPGVPIFENTNAIIERGDKIALIGANGKGKSTMLRMIAGVEPFNGKLTTGHNVITSFYAQHQLESLNLKHTMLEELQMAAPTESDTTLRTILGAFLFSGDDVFKKIRVLSGGEKSRVALAKTMLTRSNFLLLDEPTNHLDMKSVNTLIAVLKEYKGSFLVISHDRYFLDAIANKIWYIEDKELKTYPGNYEEYDAFAARNQIDKRAENKANKEKEVKPVAVKKEVNTPKVDPKIKQNLTRDFQKLDADLESLKKEKLQLELEMAKPEIALDSMKLSELIKIHSNLAQTISTLNKKWESAFEALSELEES